jgi:hypothetical protein
MAKLIFQIRTVYEAIWKNMAESDRTHENTIRPMRFACWITKAIVTHLEYVLLNAFPRQQWLRERASVLRLQVHCLSY